jgi:hypothetical protein
VLKYCARQGLSSGLTHGLRVESLGKQRQTLLQQCTLLGEITGRGGRFELLQLVDGGAAQRGYCPGSGSVVTLGAADILVRKRQPHRAVRCDRAHQFDTLEGGGV